MGNQVDSAQIDVSRRDGQIVLTRADGTELVNPVTKLCLALSCCVAEMVPALIFVRPFYKQLRWSPSGSLHKYQHDGTRLPQWPNHVFVPDESRDQTHAVVFTPQLLGVDALLNSSLSGFNLCGDLWHLIDLGVLAIQPNQPQCMLTISARLRTSVLGILQEGELEEVVSETWTFCLHSVPDPYAEPLWLFQYEALSVFLELDFFPKLLSFESAFLDVNISDFMRCVYACCSASPEHTAWVRNLLNMATASIPELHSPLQRLLAYLRLIINITDILQEFDSVVDIELQAEYRGRVGSHLIQLVTDHAPYGHTTVLGLYRWLDYLDKNTNVQALKEKFVSQIMSLVQKRPVRDLDLFLETAIGENKHLGEQGILRKNLVAVERALTQTARASIASSILLNMSFYRCELGSFADVIDCLKHVWRFFDTFLYPGLQLWLVTSTSLMHALNAIGAEEESRDIMSQSLRVLASDHFLHTQPEAEIRSVFGCFESMLQFRYHRINVENGVRSSALSVSLSGSSPKDTGKDMLYSSADDEAVCNICLSTNSFVRCCRSCGKQDCFVCLDVSYLMPPHSQQMIHNSYIKRQLGKYGTGLRNDRPTFDDVLNDRASFPYTLAAYKAFLAQQDCLESLEFVREARRYSAKYNESTANSTGVRTMIEPYEGYMMLQYWHRLLDTYIKSTAPRYIRLPAKERNSLSGIRYQKEAPRPEALDPIVTAVLDNLSVSTFIPFCDRIEASMTGHKHPSNDEDTSSTYACWWSNLHLLTNFKIMAADSCIGETDYVSASSILRSSLDSQSQITGESCFMIATRLSKVQRRQNIATENHSEYLATVRVLSEKLDETSPEIWKFGLDELELLASQLIEPRLQHELTTAVNADHPSSKPLSDSRGMKNSSKASRTEAYDRIKLLSNYIEQQTHEQHHEEPKTQVADGTSFLRAESETSVRADELTDTNSSEVLTTIPDLVDTDGGIGDLQHAAFFGDTAVVGLLLSGGADINMRDDKEATPLHWAACNGHDATTALLLDKGADINARDKNLATPLRWAASYGKGTIVALLLSRGATIDAKDKNTSTPLHEAAYKGHELIVTLLLDRGANIEAKNSTQATPLHEAIGNGHDTTSALLLERGAKINVRNQHRATPLHWAAYHGQNTTVALLLNRGASAEVRDIHGSSCLHMAARSGQSTTVALLLNRWIAVDARDKNQVTTLHEAAANGQDATVARLLDKGADSDARDQDRATPLHWAASRGHDKVVALLLNHGANIDAMDNRRRTPSDIAREQGD